MAYRIYRSHAAAFVESTDDPENLRTIDPSGFDELFRASDPLDWIAESFAKAAVGPLPPLSEQWAAPIGSQEVWAAGVTYYRSRSARMEEAETAGGDIFYDKVYEADRPEIFFKSASRRVRGHGQTVGIRRDSSWDVPEPEFTLAINARGRIFGHTVGNDMSSRSIEGENPLYLPQAKVYRHSCALGPCLCVGEAPGPETAIRVEIERGGERVFEGETSASQIKRRFEELADWLFRSSEFPDGVYLMTGTGIVPDSDFTLAPGDRVAITVDPVGTLANVVETV